MAEQDSTTNGAPRTLKELSEKSGVDLRTIERMLEDWGPQDPLELAQRQITQILTIGGLMEDSAWAADDFAMDKDMVESLAGIIMDMAHKAQEHLELAQKFIADIAKSSAQAAAQGSETEAA